MSVKGGNQRSGGTDQDRVRVVGIHTILSARISSTPMRLITRSKTSSGSDVKPVPGLGDMIEGVEIDFEMRTSNVDGSCKQS
jgi:hypothetical protein